MRGSADVLADLVNGGASKRFAVFAAALGLMLLVGIWLMFDLLPDLVVDDRGLTVNDRLQRENDARTTGLQALAGVVLAIGGAFTAYSVLSNREDKLDERFARSLGLMGSSEPHVVSGASETNLHEADLRGARYRGKARFADGFDPAEHGMTAV